MEHVKVNIDTSQYMQSLNSEFQSIHNLLYVIAIMLFAIFVVLFGILSTNKVSEEKENIKNAYILFGIFGFIVAVITFCIGTNMIG